MGHHSEYRKGQRIGGGAAAQMGVVGEGRGKEQ